MEKYHHGQSVFYTTSPTFELGGENGIDGPTYHQFEPNNSISYSPELVHIFPNELPAYARRRAFYENHIGETRILDALTPIQESPTSLSPTPISQSAPPTFKSINMATQPQSPPTWKEDMIPEPKVQIVKPKAVHRDSGLLCLKAPVKPSKEEGSYERIFEEEVETCLDVDVINSGKSTPRPESLESDTLESFIIEELDKLQPLPHHKARPFGPECLYGREMNGDIPAHDRRNRRPPPTIFQEVELRKKPRKKDSRPKPASRAKLYEPPDGCVILGGDFNVNGDFGPKTTYATRYRIFDRDIQRQDALLVVKEAMCPYSIIPKEDDTCLSFLWCIAKSYPFLYLLMILVFLSQVLKSLYITVAINADMHVILAFWETAIVCFVIAIQFVTTRERFMDLQMARTSLEHVHNMDEIKAKAENLRTWYYVLLVIAIAICLINMLALIMLHFHIHLNWTILTNNCGLVLVLLAAILTRSYISGLIHKINLDYHKIVLLEAVTLMGELYYSDNVHQRRFIREQVGRFYKSLKETQHFAAPEYIVCPKQCTLSMEVMEGVEFEV